MNRSRRLSFLFGSFATLLVGSCECQRAESQARAFPARTNPPLYLADQVEWEDIRDFYKRVFGQDEYTTKWSELDKFQSGSVPTIRIPYRDSWYPESTKGTNLGGALTKYDNAFHGGQSKAAQWELANHSRAEPYWYGHCNGTSVAVTRFQNPVRNVTRPKGCTAGTNGCTEFTPADIRALLSEINMNAKAKFISGNRCQIANKDLVNPKKRPIIRANPERMDECDDVNPGSFHVSLVNFLGRRGQPIVIDLHQDEQVWNYPVYAYTYTREGPWTAEKAITTLRNSVKDANGNSAFPPSLDGDKWIFNPKAQSFMYVKLTVSYRFATDDTVNAGTKPEPARNTYEYILELDSEGQVIGGEWLGYDRAHDLEEDDHPNEKYHPDFIWVPFEPAEPTGANSRGNAFISNSEVVKLWAESVGFNPDAPFHDKPKNAYDVRFYPPSDLAWGTVRGYYRLLLDGRTTGSAFLGKKTHLRVETQDILKGDSTVEVSLNGQPLPAGDFQDGKMDILFDSPPGINLLTLRWTSGRVDTSELNWDFRFYAM